jgi:hypothetical protein
VSRILKRQIDQARHGGARRRRITGGHGLVDASVIRN